MNIKVEKLNFNYDEKLKDSKNVLTDISFEIKNNESVAIIGDTGSGKTTLALHLNGILRATSGKVFVDGKNIYDDDYDLNRLRYKIGLVFQYPEYQLFAETVIDDVMFGAKNMGLDDKNARDRAEKILLELGIKEEQFNKLPFLLSGGEKRKVAIAGVLIMEPDVIILDEPQAGLDNIARVELFEMLKKLHESGKTIIFITLNLSDVVEYADSVLLLHNGLLLKKASVAEVFNDAEVIKNGNVLCPEQVYINHELKKVYKNFDNTKIKTKDLIEEILKIKND